MRHLQLLSLVVVPGLAVVFAGCSSPGDENPGSSSASVLNNPIPTPTSALQEFSDSSGKFANFTTAGHFDTNNEFFQKLGTNGRVCATCHRPENGFSIRTDTIGNLFSSTNGHDPLFRLVDGANTPNEDVSTLAARRNAYSLLLNRGVIRIGLPVPTTNAEFTLVNIQDPYGYATADNLSMYRRPLMSTNLRFVVGSSPCVGCTTTPIMWDGREPNLQSQANHATLGHAEATQPLTTDQQNSIVAFETALFTAQDYVTFAGSLNPAGGGPVALSRQPFAFKMNTVGPIPAPPITQQVFTLFPSWQNSHNDKQQSILRGQTIFNSRQLKTNPAGIPITCSSCHSSLNVGGNDFPEPPINQGNIGSAGGGPLAPPSSAQFLAADLPVYTFMNNTTGATVNVNDPGVAMITGKWNDLGRFKTPNLRGLAAHGPYFHNGLAPTLGDVVDFYNVTFAQNFPPGNIGPFTDQERADLIAFLSAL